MKGSFLHFLSYHNTVPVFFGILFLGTTATFAASPEAREMLYTEQPIVQSVDNSYIASVDLDTFLMQITVGVITEDDTAYYVPYALDTIDIADYVWQNVRKENVLMVHKAALEGRDLGLYIEEELSEVRDFELARLRETQKAERGSGVTQKAVATVYSGVFGKFLSPTVETFEGYNPVIAPVVPAPWEPPTVATTPPASELPPSSSGSPSSSDTEPPLLRC